MVVVHCPASLPTLAAVNLQRHLVLRVTLAGIACWLLVSVLVLTSAVWQLQRQLAAEADRVADRLGRDMERQLTAQLPGAVFPDLPRVAAMSAAPLCMIVWTAGRQDHHGCAVGSDGEPNRGRRAAVLRPVQRDLGLWGQPIGGVELSADARWLGFQLLSRILPLLGLAALTIGVLDVLIVWVLRRALQPAGQLVAALASVDRHPWQRPPQLRGVREFELIADGIAELAERLAQAAAQRERLTARMLVIQDEERRELAQRLHEEFGPRLVGLGARLAALKMIAPAALVDDIEPLDIALEQLLDALRGLLLSQGSEPPVGQTLAGAINDVLTQWRAQGRARCAVSVQLDPGLTVDDARRRCIYLTVQEALSNVLRHAPAAASLQIQLGYAGDAALLRMANELDAAAPAVRGCGQGLALLAARARALGGELSIFRDARWFELSLRLPLGAGAADAGAERDASVAGTAAAVVAP